MDDTMRSCREFTAVLSSAAPAPGGGGAAALTAAVGTALCGMVANLTTGKKAYSAVESDIQQLLSTTNALQEKLLDQVAADAEGFLPLAAVYAYMNLKEVELNNITTIIEGIRYNLNPDFIRTHIGLE